MNLRSSGFAVPVLTSGLALAWLTVVGLAAASPRTPPGPSPAAVPGAAVQAGSGTPASGANGYVGAGTCMGCHDNGESLKRTLHGQARDPRTPAGGQGCEACHGPGQKHVESGSKSDIKTFDTMAPRDVSETCLTCHSGGTHANWKGGMHDARNLSCTTCHSVHQPKSERAQLKKASVVEMCATCHKQEVAKLQRVGHMPVREGKMDCTSCHNPHGSTNVRMLKVGNWVNELCVSCHTEKRGPYLWDHAPVREACSNCHDPHGSNNDRMLVAKLPMLCQRCHIGTRHPSTIYDGTQLAAKSNRLIGRGCVNCHAQIHGSNSPAGNTLLR